VEVGIILGEEFIIGPPHNLFPGSAHKAGEFRVAAEIDTGTILEEDTVGDGIQEAGKKGRLLGKSFGRVADIMAPLFRGASFKERFKGRWLAGSHKNKAFLPLWIIILTEISMAIPSWRPEVDALGPFMPGRLAAKDHVKRCGKTERFQEIHPPEGSRE
jgi:hypothetical protein